MDFVMAIEEILESRGFTIPERPYVARHDGKYNERWIESCAMYGNLPVQVKLIRHNHTVWVHCESHYVTLLSFCFTMPDLVTKEYWNLAAVLFH